MTYLSPQFLNDAKKTLINIKQDLLNRKRTIAADFQNSSGFSGDEIDQSVSVMQEHTLLKEQDRLQRQLLEVEYALHRIENGNYGVCEETGEEIERQRLELIPYTRYSVEGAEIREQEKKRATL
jgi:DnaK suppressor protein